MTLLTAAEVSESARAFLAAVSVAPDVLELRPDYRVLVMMAEGLEPGLPDEISDELLARAEIRARITLDGRVPVGALGADPVRQRAGEQQQG